MNLTRRDPHIAFEGEVPAARPEDADDLLGTYLLSLAIRTAPNVIRENSVVFDKAREYTKAHGKALKDSRDPERKRLARERYLDLGSPCRTPTIR